MTEKNLDAEFNIEEATLNAEEEIENRRNYRLYNSLDRLLPLAKKYIDIPFENGGPSESDLITDPNDNSSKTMQEIVDAEEALFTTEVLEDNHAESINFDHLDESDFLEERAESDDQGNPLLKALFDANATAESINAHRIAGLEIEEDLQKDLRIKLIKLAEELANHFEDGN